MRLSLSTRIFAGFLVVLLAFSAVMVYTFHGMNRLRQDLHLINKSYLKLTLDLSELSAIQGNLPNKVDEQRAGLTTSPYLRSQVREARRFRLIYVQRALETVQASRQLSTAERELRFMSRTAERLTSLEHAFRQNEPAFDALFAENAPPAQSAAERVAQQLLPQERKLLQQIRSLRDDLRRQVNSVALQVEENENNAAWATLILAVVAIIVSLAVTVGAQWMLRPLKKLVAGTKRIGSGDYGHRVTVSSRDELGLLAREFNSMAAALEERESRLIRSERMAAAGQIASHITHEIRNPLSSISLNTELLEDELAGLEEKNLTEARSLLSAMRREVDRLTDITEEYLRFARLPRPHLAVEDLNEILLNLSSFMASELREKKVEVQHDLPEIPNVEADENQLRQAFLNLVRNATEAMAQDGGLLQIASASDGEWVQIRIVDNGSGIPSKDLSKIFEPFFSTKKSGTGLGLAITQQIIQEHGGTITVQSKPAQGTAFTIRLPIHQAVEKLE
jgi:two-component system, NtrC family, sensor kinase